ncbi:MAG: hypothetical protein K6E29_05595 [Cyanobacteria bacterium RUI128]|nr:hypothetical protein [Cyanobacteria bacterium RUI128]
MCTVSFTARLVDKPTIQQRTSWLNYKDQKVSIVELERANRNDMRAFSDASSAWMKNGGRYAGSMLDIAIQGNYRSNLHKNHYYALTTQTGGFDKLSADKILGLMLFYENADPANEIGLLEVNPSTSRSNNFLRKYKQVGKKLVEYVQSEYPQKDIAVWSDYSARKFYRKMGFVNKSKDVCDLCWRAVK